MEYGIQIYINMINVVVIGHNEGAYVEDVVKSIGSSDNIIYVADRCTDSTKKICSKLGVRCIQTPHIWEGRKTSSSRNLGLSLCDKTSDVLFLDGDRCLVDGSIIDIENTSDIVCLPLKDDFRTKTHFEESFGYVLSGFYSCGIFFKRKAIDVITRFQGELFPTSVEQVWGIEDTCLGDVCYHLNLSAELSEKVKLRGSFSRRQVDSLDVIEMRLRFREHLNVKW